MTTKTGEKDSFFKDYSDLMESVQVMTKSEDNPFFKSKYVPLSDILEEAKKVCKAHNFIFIQMPFVRENSKDVLITELQHKDGRRIECAMPLVRKDMDDPQKLGASLTYMRRYSLTSILGIMEADDDGNEASTPKPGIMPKKPISVRSTQSYEATAKPKDGNEPTIADNLREIERMSLAMKHTDDEATNYVLSLASFESKKEPGKFIKPKWEQFAKNEKWVFIVLKKLQADFEKWMKNEKTEPDESEPF